MVDYHSINLQKYKKKTQVKELLDGEEKFGKIEEKVGDEIT